MRDSKRNTNVKNSLLDSARRQGWADLKGRIETCILSCVKWIASPGSMHETGCSGLGHWDDLGGWDGEGGERGVLDGEHVYPWLIHVNVWQKPLQYCKLISL